MTKDKYLHHELSMNLEKKWLNDVNLENYLEKKILKTLLKSRQTLINTYVFSYFYISPFFENQLTNLEIVTDKLSHLLKSDLDEQNFTLIKITSEECEKLRNELSGHIEHGHKKDWWINKEQPKNVKFEIAEDDWQELLIRYYSYFVVPVTVGGFYFLKYFYDRDHYITRLFETCSICNVILAFILLIFRHI